MKNYIILILIAVIFLSGCTQTQASHSVLTKENITLKSIEWSNNTVNWASVCGDSQYSSGHSLNYKLRLTLQSPNNQQLYCKWQIFGNKESYSQPMDSNTTFIIQPGGYESDYPNLWIDGVFQHGIIGPNGAFLPYGALGPGLRPDQSSSVQLCCQLYSAVLTDLVCGNPIVLPAKCQ